MNELIGKTVEMKGFVSNESFSQMPLFVDGVQNRLLKSSGVKRRILGFG